MRILIAPDKFKGCLSAVHVSRSIAEGIAQADPSIQVDHCPLADGGEGTVSALVEATGGRLVTRTVTGPLPEIKVTADFGQLGDGSTAVIEMASASGLHLLQPNQYGPLATTTFGVGELIKYAVQIDVTRIIIGLGGSATCDAGIGCAQGAGLPVLLQDGEPTYDTEPLCGRDMDRVVLVKNGRGARVDGVEIIAACDVTNPLFGPTGAAYVFAAQKGATPEEVRTLDDLLKNLATRLGKLDIARQSGAGSAGGLGFGLLAYFGARLQSGFDLIAQAVNLRHRISHADLVITGEGNLDRQTLAGKTAFGVARICKDLGKPCIALAGRVESGVDFKSWFISNQSIAPMGMPVEESIRRACELLTLASRNLIRSPTYSLH